MSGRCRGVWGVGRGKANDEGGGWNEEEVEEERGEEGLMPDVHRSR